MNRFTLSSFFIKKFVASAFCFHKFIKTCKLIIENHKILGSSPKIKYPFVTFYCSVSPDHDNKTFIFILLDCHGLNKVFLIFFNENKFNTFIFPLSVRYIFPITWVLCFRYIWKSFVIKMHWMNTKMIKKSRPSLDHLEIQKTFL